MSAHGCNGDALSTQRNNATSPHVVFISFYLFLCVAAFEQTLNQDRGRHDTHYQQCTIPQNLEWYYSIICDNTLVQSRDTSSISWLRWRNTSSVSQHHSAEKSSRIAADSFTLSKFDFLLSDKVKHLYSSHVCLELKL